MANLALDGELQGTPQEHRHRWQVEPAGGHPRRLAIGVAAAVRLVAVPARVIAK